MRKPSAATVIATVALFVALGGVGVAATGDNFIIGQSNTATTNTSLSAPVAGGNALQLTNTDTSNAASTALGLTVASNHAPFTVNTGVKVVNLNSERLDGFDSSYFQPKTGKAADSDKLDGMDSTAFTQGGGRFYAAHREGVPVSSTDGTLLDIPGALKVTYHCGSESGAVAARLTLASDNLDVVTDSGGSGSGHYYHVGSGTPLDYVLSLLDNAPDPALYVDMVGSHPFNRVLFTKGVLVQGHFAMVWHPATSTCMFQGLAERFDG
jgi:hypothetical protein